MSGYEDIIDRERPLSRRPRMALIDRAKIFGSFAALKGYEEAAQEQARPLVSRTELSEWSEQRLDRRLRALERGQRAAVVWFEPVRGEQGCYRSAVGTVQGVDPLEQVLLLDERKIPFSELLEVGNPE